MIRILTIVGARPQFVKAAVLSRKIQTKSDFEEIIVHTGQHYNSNMSEVFFEELDIPKPNYNLGIGNLSHAKMTGQMMDKIEDIILNENPDWVLVYGDTNSTLAGALTARKLHKRIAHVEAGLRSFNMKMPEEINRILTDRISDLLFCPTDTAMKNLESEGFENFQGKFIKSGDIMFDAVRYYQKAIHSQNSESIAGKLNVENFVLCTIHRQENTDSKEYLANIFAALDEVNKECSVVLPLHPRTKKLLKMHNIQTAIKLIDPVGYLEMLKLLSECSLVITDSGGLQKEAYFSRKKCITVRDTTEWVELIDNGCNFLAGNNKEKILEAFEKAKDKECDFDIDLYGNGKTAEVILREIEEFKLTEISE